jgi:hypothetical protein
MTFAQCAFARPWDLKGNSQNRQLLTVNGEFRKKEFLRLPESRDRSGRIRKPDFWSLCAIDTLLKRRLLRV